MGGYALIAMAAIQAVQMVSSQREESSAAKQQANAQDATYARQRSQMEAAHKIEEDRRARDLKSSQASARAAMGASGAASAGGGSAQAVLNGLAKRSDEDAAEAHSTYAYRLADNDAERSHSNRMNLLNRQAQKRKQWLDGANLGMNTYSSFASFGARGRAP